MPGAYYFMQLNHYTVIDVETANQNRSSICQIAIQEVDHGQIVFEASSLINPEERFNSICVDIHGIEEDDVKNAPTMVQYWPTIKEHCVNTIFVAHNAIFDVSALSASLEKYHISAGESLPYVCTMLLAKRLLPQRRSKPDKNEGLEIDRSEYGFGLAPLCSYYHIDMIKHHDALSDVEACRHLLHKLLSCTEGEIIAEDIHEYRCPIQSETENASKTASPRTLPTLGQIGVKYCLTGKFALGARSRVVELIQKSGGLVSDSMCLDTDYLVLGNLKKPNEKPSAKENKARQMLERGYILAIISETEFVKGLKTALKAKGKI